jgi:hypothetical protein
MRRRVACGVAVVAACVGAGPAAATRALRIEGPYGSGAAQVWLLRPVGAARSIVVFGHGWKGAPPSSEHPWVRQFAPWLTHLLDGGNVVVFPRYQLGGDAPGRAFVDAYRRGLALAFDRLDRSLPVVVLGYSYGATLGVTYAANAGRWGLPHPRAVDAVFPAGLVPGIALPRLDPAVAVLVQVGDADTESGTSGAAAILSWLRGHGRTRYERVRSRGAFVAVHAAPKGTSAAARAAFWAPLDALIARARVG